MKREDPWSLSPYHYLLAESDACSCDSRLCPDCSPTPRAPLRAHGSDFWLAYYKLKRTLFRIMRLGA